MFLKTLLAFGLALGIFAGIVAVQPSTYTVTRTATIAAPPATVFPLVNDFHKWHDWSPWAKLDPAMKQTYEGSPAGAGAIYRWSGNKQAGAGDMTITDSQPNERVAIDLAFTKPYPSQSRTAFAIRPEGNGSAVTWTMTGHSNFMLKAVELFSSMDNMVGPDFDKGLTQLKSLAESPIRTDRRPAESAPLPR